MNVLSGNKDTDLLILAKLNDRDLFNVCSIKNKYINRICRDEFFWRNRFVNKFGDKYLFLKETKTWRNHYLQTISDLEIYKSDPWYFFQTISWHVNEGIRGVRVWDFSINTPNIKSISEADDSWKANYYYLNLGNSLNINYGLEKRYYRTDTYFTPKDLIEKIANHYNNFPLFKNKFFYGFEKDKHYYDLLLVN